MAEMLPEAVEAHYTSCSTFRAVVFGLAVGYFETSDQPRVT